MKTRLSVISIIFVMVLLLASGIMSAAEYDFGGDTITYMHAGEEFEDGDDAAYLESVEEDFNVEIEFLDWSWQEQRDSLIPGIMAGDPPADVYHWSYGWTWQQNVVAQGGLYPLDNILGEDYYNSIPEFEREFVKEYTTFNNETLGFYSKAQGAVRFIMWNKDMFERE
ncbi:MAG: extracellular solute-binding protein, partial [Bacillota bacterium]